MVKPQGAGGSLRSNLESIWRQTGVKPEELQDKELPLAARCIWEWFLELHNSRGNGGVAPSPISFSDILAWSTLTGIEPTPFDISCITALDNLWLSTL